jgi:hypothetical protein
MTTQDVLDPKSSAEQTFGELLPYHAPSQVFNWVIDGGLSIGQ